MKKTYLIILTALLCVGLIACKSTAEQSEKVDGNHKGEVETPSDPVGTTVDPFEFESEIDFSDFEIVETAPSEAPTEPSEPEPTHTSTVDPTEPKPTEPTPTEPTISEPEVTEPITTKPSLGPDGYNNQIVRP